MTWNWATAANRVRCSFLTSSYFVERSCAASRRLQCIVNHQPLNDDGDFISRILTIKTRNSEGRSASKYFLPTPMSTWQYQTRTRLSAFVNYNILLFVVVNLNSYYNTSTETSLCVCLCVQVILLVAFACVRSTWYTSFYSYGFFEGVTLGYSITVAVFLFLTVFGVPKRASFVNWTIAVSIVTYNIIATPFQITILTKAHK